MDFHCEIRSENPDKKAICCSTYQRFTQILAAAALLIQT